MQEWQSSGFSVWIGPEIEAEDEEGRLFLSQYLTKCPVKLSRLSIERKDEADVVRYTSDKDTREFTPLDFLAEVSAHIPGTFEQTIRFYGEYSPRTRGKRRAAAAQEKGEASNFVPLSALEPNRATSRSWARLIKKIYEIDPLVCPKCGSSMKIKAFVTEPKEVARPMEGLHPPPLRSAEKTDPNYWDAV